MRMKGRWKVVAIVVAVVIAAGAMAGVALGNTSNATGSAAGSYWQEFVSKLAANLGVSQDKLSAALDTTKQQMLAEAVQQGRLTQAQADKIASRPGFFPFGFGRGKGPGFAGVINQRNLVAQALGLTADQLQSKLQAGEKLPQIVTGQGMTMAQFQQKMLTLEQQALSQAVSQGKLTQDQANRILQRMQQRYDQLPESSSSGTSQT